MFHFQKTRYFLEQMNNGGSDLDYERRNLKIAIIDDLDVPYMENLRNSGFNVTHYKDIDNFEMIQPYPIIICDIKGVGAKFGSDKEGAHVIGEIRKLYPDKYIIAMSSAIYNVNWVESLEVADDKIIRDSDVDKVFQALNEAVDTMKCNKQRWLRIRENLIKKHHVDLFEIWKIEQAFILSSITKNKDSFIKNKAVTHMNDLIKGLLINFISGIIFSWPNKINIMN